MGYQTTVIIRNDAISEIERNPEEFVRNLLDTLRRVGLDEISHTNGLDFPCGHHANVGRVIETHHSDSTTIITSGGSTGELLATLYGKWRFASRAELLSQVIRELQVQYTVHAGGRK